jgi:hypothetical protein
MITNKALRAAAKDMVEGGTKPEHCFCFLQGKYGGDRQFYVRLCRIWQDLGYDAKHKRRARKRRAPTDKQFLKACGITWDGDARD